ncbi:pyruvate dehydrogenase (acetyl-transferring) E1 component subunit alpha [Virgibacillus profundi]|uniref:Pyruvate dehydrogenase E1 component subunit alpha n=1 Tax=Virgibacillus profundi TaxID=2024555 RepID=A0A2A2IB99_9BACI|nr:pyruvate dehydrogenase (acetyl-transferring) E1 component subunit alpha [Virgibacillus profundi]PAV28897.1 pyruvate dehydrogenase (acetyl-transferring) E1 component subunit alpha [Virgibacillus profundi]PXY53065.1 pyruvate dehydrogenase (acetyl-transferring) E1 component subunit alpha [Virgibacillus profundi]
MEANYPIKTIIDDQGDFIDDLYKDQIDEQLVENMYYHMYRIRTFDKKAISLQRQGRIGTYPPFGGQEAAQVGSALALGENDWIFPTYRDHGATLTYGADMTSMFLYWNGRVEGCIPPEGKNIFPAAVPIATQIPHAVGASWAEKRKGTDRIAVAYFGDGATSEGDFHEGLNFASVFKTPTVFFNQNNGYAISVPIEKQMNSETIAQKAVAYGMRSVRIDGNDCFAVYFETKKAVDLARAGKGPTLIEAVTWRTGAHTTADDPTKYRPADKGKDIVEPLSRLEQFMKKNGFWKEGKISEMQAQLKEEVDAAVDAMENYPEANVEDLFDHVFAELPEELVKQKETYLELLEEY